MDYVANTHQFCITHKINALASEQNVYQTGLNQSFFLQCCSLYFITAEALQKISKIKNWQREQMPRKWRENGGEEDQNCNGDWIKSDRERVGEERGKKR